MPYTLARRFAALSFLVIFALTLSPALSAQDTCGLDVNKQCQVVLPEAGAFSCSDAKPIDALSMAWKGQDGVTVKAWKGSVGGTLLAERTGVLYGQTITVDGMGGSPNDQFWEIFTASGQKLGESAFHLSCSDDQMDGPEDCGLPAGNGKGDDASLLNLWTFEGMAGSGQVLDCNPEPAPPAENCSFEKQPRPSCDSLDKPSSLTFVYTADACDPSGNDQGSKTACFESGPLGLQATITSSNSGLSISPATVEVGQEFTVSGSFGSATILTLTAGTDTQELNIHTSCSAPLAVDDAFGGLRLAAFNGQRSGTQVIYTYTVSNAGDDVTDLLVDDNLLGIVGTLPVLPGGATETFTASAVLTDTTTNEVEVSGQAPGGTLCLANDSVTVTVTEACDACKGGVTELLLKYLGAGPARVTVYDDSSAKDDKVLFDALVDTDGDIPLQKRPGQDKFNSDVSIFVDDQFHAKLHTSCSQPVGAGLRVGDFEITEGRSKDNGLMCALDTCNVAAEGLQFHDRELRLDLGNRGDANVAIDRISLSWPGINGKLVEIKREGDSIHKGAFLPPTAEIDAGWEGDTGKRTIKAGDTDTMKFKFESLADRYSNYSVTVGFDQGCLVTQSYDTLPDACDACDGGTVELALEYLGPDAQAVVYDDSSASEDKILFQGPVTTGDLVSFTRRAGKDKLNGDISIYLDGLFHAELHTSCSQPIGPELIVGDFRVASGRSRYNGPMCPLNTCDVDGQFLDIDGDKVTFPLTNLGDVDVFVNSLSIFWPTPSGHLEKVKHDGSTIQEGPFTPPFAAFGAPWEGNRDDRKVEAGDTKEMEFEFIDTASFAGVYQVHVGFDQGCSSRRIFVGPGDCGFVCEKPITMLAMRWQGGQQIDVVAWDGPPGSRYITTRTGVNPGNVISVAGISGSTNDVYWEIFSTATGEKLGESKFHLSCSDYDMNGPEDFGKPAGNGKDDSGVYLNDWTLANMEANGRLLVCEE